MKIKRVLGVSMLCALVCTPFSVINSYADELEPVEVEIHNTSTEEINNIISNFGNFVEGPSISNSKNLLEDDVYSLVSEEDTIMPELEEDNFYIKEDVELKSISEQTDEVLAKLDKGSVVKMEMCGDEKAVVSIGDKYGVVDMSVLTKEKVEPEKKEIEEKTEEKASNDKKVSEEKSSTDNKKVKDEKINTKEASKKQEPKVSLYAVEALNIRSEQSASSNKLGILSKGEKVDGIDKGDWVQFNFNGNTAYVIKSYLSKNKPVIETPKVEEKKETKKAEVKKVETSNTKKENNSYSADIETVIDIALSQVGKAYVWGSANPNVGFDCSGLVYYSFKQVGINLSRSSYTQINDGIRVSASDLRRGDLVFFSNGGSGIGHVGIYLGNNKFVHASSPGTGIIVSKLFGGYFEKTFRGATRIIK